MRVLAALGALVMMVGGSGGDDKAGKGDSAPPGSLWDAPAQERARTNPVSATPEALQKGRALYQKHCRSCHGESGKGDGPASRYSIVPVHDLSDSALQAALTDGDVFWKLSTGRRQGTEVIMPALSKNVPSEEDRWKVVLFVRTLAAHP